MQTSHRYITGIVVSFFIWFIVVLITQGDQPALSRFALLGDGLAPVGSVLTAAALVFAFEQHSQAARAAHLDRLADAYARWFEVARSILRKMELTARGARRAAEGAEPHAIPFHRGIVLEVYELARELRAAASPVLLFEDDEQCRARVLKVCGLLPSLSVDDDHAWRTKAVMLHEVVSAQLVELETLFDGVIARLRAGRQAKLSNCQTDTIADE